MNKAIFAAAIASTAGLAAASSSVTFDFDVENFGLGAENVVDFDFALGGIASIDSVEIELAHSWASDLEIFLTASDGRVFTLSDDNGSAVDLGDGGSLLSGTATYTFVEAAGNGTWADIGFGGVAPGGTYDADEWQSGPFGAGTWNFTMNDDAGGDDGAIGSVTINYTVPAPAGLAVLGLGGLAAARRRR